jgi:hypothetical protein
VAKAAGRSSTDAYLDAGFNVARREARKLGSRLAAKVDIIQRIEKLMAPVTKEKLMSRDEKRRIMAEIARDKKASKVDRIRAASEDAKLAGHYEPEKVTIETGDNTLEALQKRAETVVSGLNRFSGRK